MIDKIQQLLEDLRSGNTKDAARTTSWLVAALRKREPEPSFLRGLLQEPHPLIQIAGIVACVQRTELQLWHQVEALYTNKAQSVRAAVAKALAKAPPDYAPQARQTLQLMASDPATQVRITVLLATRNEPEFSEVYRHALHNDKAWDVRFAAAIALASLKDVNVVHDLFLALVHDPDYRVRQICADRAEERTALIRWKPSGWMSPSIKIINEKMTQAKAQLASCLPKEETLLHIARYNLKRTTGKHCGLMHWISENTMDQEIITQLASYGINLTELALAGKLDRAFYVEPALSDLLTLVKSNPRRSTVLLGKSGTGKTALINELVYALAQPENGRWHVLRMSPADFLVNTTYLGQWQTRLSKLVDLVRKLHRIIIYVPNVEGLPTAGRCSVSDSNVATALAPYMEDGTVLVLGESTQDEFERGYGENPSLQRVFQKVVIQEADSKQTRQILSSINTAEQANIAEEVLDHVIEMSGSFLSHVGFPGSAAGFLKQVIAWAKERGAGPASFGDVLQVLAKSTGLPIALVDDRIPLNLQEVHKFFEQRIMGQPEAVGAVVDLVTLIKAGLTDPNKPFGVFMFVGPTGVGKTELARALAEFIFGDAGRLLRFDMSEFASPESFQRLIGGRGEHGMLTHAVIKQPFSVILFDEIEKSHLNVYDLCLQIFDAGRLTDGQGRTADFRRTIVILTSNIGAHFHQAAMGFGVGAALATPEADMERTSRELARFFRPEFLNRLDRIIHFRALSLEVAEQIARREVELVLERSGVRRRHLLVSIAPSVISFLVREGYSAHFGARPLKRTTERLLLLPLARAIASGQMELKTVVSISVREKHLNVSVVPLPKPGVRATAKKPSRSFAQDIEGLAKRLEAVLAQTSPLAARKSALVAQTQAEGFYNNTPLRKTTFDEIHKLDEFLALQEGLSHSLEELRQRIQQPVQDSEAPALVNRIEVVADELDHVEHVARCQEAQDLSDALLCVNLVSRSGTTQRGVEQLTQMYLAYGSRLRVSTEILGELCDDKNECAYVLFTGLGAFGLFKNEAGLHRLDRKFQGNSARERREQMHDDREVIRVQVLPMFADPPPEFAPALKQKATALKPLRHGQLGNWSWNVNLFHEPTLRSLQLWVSGTKAQVIDKAIRILHAQVSAPATALQKSEELARHYELGIGSQIKDIRTGRSTSRIAPVFKGHLEVFH